MRFDLIDWALLILVSAVASATARFAMGLLMMLARPEVLPLFLMGVIFFLLNAYAPWLILRNCLGGLGFGRWIGVNVLGGLAGLLASSAFQPGWVGPTGMLSWWLAVIAANAAYYIPPGLLLQRLSGTNAWPFVIASATSGLISDLLGLTAPPVPRGGLGLAWGVAISLGQGAISGLGLGAGLFLMARRGAGTRTSA